MTVETRVHEALPRVRAECERVDGRRCALDRFARGVREIPAESAPAPTAPAGTVGGATTASATGRRASADRRRDVRDLFAETIRPYSVDDTEPLVETIGAELGRDVAVALSPESTGRFTPQLRRTVLSAASKRRAECEAMALALEREVDSLERAASGIDEITAWLVRANETPLSALGFDALRERHEALAARRDWCRRLLRDRQATLAATTRRNGDAGVRHRSLVTYLYQAFPTTYPALTTLLRLAECCAECQRAVRDHLVRRA